MHSIEVIRPPSDYPEEVIKWFMREYLSNHGIDLTVVYMDLSDEGVDGWCMREDDHEFIIQINEPLALQTILFLFVFFAHGKLWFCLPFHGF